MLSSRFAANERILSRLEDDLSCGRLPHAILLTGESGCGKTSLAMLIAAGIVCTGTGKPCGECRHCRKAFSGAHPDIMLYGSKQRLASFKKEDMDNLREQLYLSPSEAAAKAFILDDVRDLTLWAANSLLKALEEPPENTYLILTADSRFDVLPTVLSRVVEFPLTLPLPEQAAPFVADLCGVSQEEAVRLAKRFSGNIGRCAEYCGSEEERETASLVDRILNNQKARDGYALTLELLSLNGGERRKIIAVLNRLYEQYCRIVASKTGSARFGGVDLDLPVGTALSSCDAVRKATDYLSANASTQTVLVWLAAELKR